MAARATRHHNHIDLHTTTHLHLDDTGVSLLHLLDVAHEGRGKLATDAVTRLNLWLLHEAKGRADGVVEDLLEEDEREPDEAHGDAAEGYGAELDAFEGETGEVEVLDEGRCRGNSRRGVEGHGVVEVYVYEGRGGGVV